MQYLNPYYLDYPDYLWGMVSDFRKALSPEICCLLIKGDLKGY